MQRILVLTIARTDFVCYQWGVVPISGIHHLLREWRTRTGLLQKEAASLFGVEVRTYQGWESGKHSPPKACIGCVMQKINSHVGATPK